MEQSRESSSCTASTQAIEHDRFYFDDGTALFEVEGILYNLHRYHFRNSEVFQQIFHNHVISGSADLPISLRDLRRVYWDRFLSMLYPSQIGRCDLHTAEEWFSVAYVAASFGFPQLGALALDRFHLVATPIDRIVLSSESSMPGMLGADAAFRTLIARREPLTVEENRRLGVENATYIARMREYHHIPGRRPDFPIDVDNPPYKSEE